MANCLSRDNGKHGTSRENIIAYLINRQNRNQYHSSKRIMMKITSFVAHSQQQHQKHHQIVCALVCGVVLAGTKSKSHPHHGTLNQYDGKHIHYTITSEQEHQLGLGHPVTINERSGSHGRGIALQDIAAPPHICLDRISDLLNYPKMVPKVKKVEVYEEIKFDNGTSKVGAEFEVGISLLKFNYYLLLTHDPAYQTFTWTLDYKYNSDFDDSVGHWQVMPHPTKEGWSRVLYSTAVLLPQWVPEFVITFLTKSALVEATTWVRKEAEKVAASPSLSAAVPELSVPDVRECFVHDAAAGTASYKTHCADYAVRREAVVPLDEHQQQEEGAVVLEETPTTVVEEEEEIEQEL